jgi:glycerol-3-phosphate dehydrogenase (NAD(P)+)
MSIIAVLGAGYMGSAVTFPLAAARHEVRLWGTWLDDPLLEACREGAHPKLKLPLPSSVRLLPSSQLAAALEGVELIFFAISSEGFAPVMERLLACSAFRESTPIFCLTKGFVERNGEILRPSQCAEAMCRAPSRASRRLLRWASVGGPVKAVELAHRVPTASVYACSDPALESLLPSFCTPYYRVHAGEDQVGLELCAALKNAYAILLGICDGALANQEGRAFDNLKALLFSKAVEEMAEIAMAAGGRRQTAFGLAGAGDLFVTAASGRNRRYGERVGRGEEPGKTYESMCAAGEIAEGYPAVRVGGRLLERLFAPSPGRRWPGQRRSGRRWSGGLPAFRALERLLAGGQPCLPGLSELVLRWPEAAA